MAYTALLNSLIEESGLTIKDIAERCQKQNVKVTSAYISTLRNNADNRTPSEDVSKAIAKACGAKYENILVVEAYLEKAPKEVISALNYLKKTALIAAMGLLENKITTQQKKEAEELINQVPLSEFIMGLSDDIVKQTIVKQQGTMSLKTTNEFTDMKITQTLEQAVGLPVNDDGMYPKIKKGDKVNFIAKEYKDYATGDILLFVDKNSDKSKKQGIIVRQAIFNESKKDITMVAINTEYSIRTYKKEDVVIMGKVTQVITDIK